VLAAIVSENGMLACDRGLAATMESAMRAAFGAVRGAGSALFEVSPRLMSFMHISMKRVRAASAQNGSDDLPSVGMSAEAALVNLLYVVQSLKIAAGTVTKEAIRTELKITRPAFPCGGDRRITGARRCPTQVPSSPRREQPILALRSSAADAPDYPGPAPEHGGRRHLRGVLPLRTCRAA